MDRNKALSCPFPKLSSEVFSGLNNGALKLTYSLVATGVPYLSDLHLHPALHLTIVDDPQFKKITTVNYSPSLMLKIEVSIPYRYVYTNHLICKLPHLIKLDS